MIIFLSTYLVPLGLIPFMIYQKMIENVHITKRRERYVPLVISFILYGFCYYLIQRIDIPKLYTAFLFSSMMTVLLTLLINIKYKISIHMVGIGGLVALIGYLSFFLRVNLQFYLIVALLLAGLIGTSRLVLKAHTPDEVYTGFIAGFATVLLTLMIY